jgi:hypothetical protein
MRPHKCEVVDLNDVRTLVGRLKVLRTLVCSNFHLEEPDFFEVILGEMTEFLPMMTSDQRNLSNQINYVATNAVWVTSETATDI